MVNLSKEELADADAEFDTYLERYVQETGVYQSALVRYMLKVGADAAQPKLDEALNRIGHVESRIIESQREGIS
jgi:phage gp36-like protein